MDAESLNIQPTYEELLDILEAQNAYINELLIKVKKINQSNVTYIPPVIENGVMVKLGRTIY